MAAIEHLSGEQFVSHLNKAGGASMDIRSGRLLAPGRKGFMVGGETDRSGNQIPSYKVPETEFGPEHVEKFASHLRDTVGSTHNMYIGGWKNEGQVYLDASRKVNRPGEAVRKGRARNQISVWDNRRMDEIPTGGTDE